MRLAPDTQIVEKRKVVFRKKAFATSLKNCPYKRLDFKTKCLETDSCGQQHTWLKANKMK